MQERTEEVPNYRGPRKNQDTFIGLREQTPLAGLSPLQEAYLGHFVAQVLSLGMACYVATMGQGGGVRLRVFNGDDKYEDVLGLHEDWGPVFDSYAKALGGQNEWRVRAAQAHATTPPAAPGTTKGGKP